jgi:DNA invertase Pin-like site-specific DNA recombinase
MNNNSSNPKITDGHLAKLAYVYIRQSTVWQVEHNTESTARQYELKDRAVALGWPAANIKVIDQDLGKSGARADGREGFQQLLAEISLGQVGMVLSLEAARLARNCSDWYRMLELCSIFGTIIADYELVYDPRLYHDRLLLGLAGMMSEAELHHIRMRMVEGQRHKAERGELRLPLPVGLERQPGGEVILTPDEEIQTRLRMVFAKFVELGSAFSVVRYLRTHDLPIPIRPRRGPEPYDIVWLPAKRGTVLNILKNPAYAGAYVYGKTKTDLTRRKPGINNSGIVQVPMDQWGICIQDTYPSYISWDQFAANQKRLDANQYMFQAGKQGAARGGAALLQGIAVCGKCGARMWARYRGAHGEQAGYICNQSTRELSEPRCQGILATEIDSEVERQILAALDPDKISIALKAFEQLEEEEAGLERQWKLRLERSHYEAQRAQRQYQAVEPENRLVARNLEKNWEAKLQAAEKLDREYEQWRRSHSITITAADRQEILALGENLPKIWYAETTTHVDRKRIVRLLIKDVLLDRTREKGLVWMQINWQIGAMSQHWIKPRVRRYDDMEQADLLRRRIEELKAAGNRDGDIAEILGAEGFQTTTGGKIDRGAIWHLRQIWGIDSDKKARRKVVDRWDDGSYTLEGAAAVIGAHPRTIYTWISRGMLDARQPFKHAPWKINLSEERIRELRDYLSGVRRLPANYSNRR